MAEEKEGCNYCVEGLCRKPGAVYRLEDAMNNALYSGKKQTSFYVKESSWHKVKDMVAEIDPQYNYNAAAGTCTLTVDFFVKLQ